MKDLQQYLKSRVTRTYTRIWWLFVLSVSVYVALWVGSVNHDFDRQSRQYIKKNKSMHYERNALLLSLINTYYIFCTPWCLYPSKKFTPAMVRSPLLFSTFSGLHYLKTNVPSFFFFAAYANQLSIVVDALKLLKLRFILKVRSIIHAQQRTTH